MKFQFKNLQIQSPQNPIDSLTKKSLRQLKSLLRSYGIQEVYPAILIFLVCFVVGVFVRYPALGLLLGIIIPCAYYKFKNRLINSDPQKQSYIYPKNIDYNLISYCSVTNKSKEVLTSTAIYQKYRVDTIFLFSSPLINNDKIEFDSCKEYAEKNISRIADTAILKNISSIDVLFVKTTELLNKISTIIFGHFIFNNELHFIVKILSPSGEDIDILCEQLIPIIKDFIELNQVTNLNPNLLKNNNNLKN